MAAEPDIQIPILTDEIRVITENVTRMSDAEAESLIAELQTQIAASTFAMTDEIMRKAFAEIEASVFEQISARLRRELPEMVDAILRERLSDTTNH